MRNRLVYSTETGAVPDEGPGKRKGGTAKAGGAKSGGAKGRGGRAGGARAAPAPPKDGTVRVSRETKGRKGKGVTVVTGVALPASELATLAKDLKALCGSGGTLRDGAIEFLIKQLNMQ